MTTQPDLFTAWDTEPPSVADSPTSIAAAKQIEPVSGALRRQVYEFIRERGQSGATDEEIIAALDMSPSTARPRRIELVQAGFVQNSGSTRRTKSGRNATVWIAAERK